MQELTPFERFQLATYGNILGQNGTVEPTETKPYGEEAYLFNIENPEQ